jgi:DNA integrity scanning protein DisA with diadenylate cyclase activity
VGSLALAQRLFQSALELAEARQGALFVVLRDPASARELIAMADRIDAPVSEAPRPVGAAPTRRDLLNLVTGRSVTELDASVLAALASLDGATVTDVNGKLLAAGAILRHSIDSTSADYEPVIIEGARTTAALAASGFGPVLKVSEDGLISFYDGTKVWDI